LTLILAAGIFLDSRFTRTKEKVDFSGFGKVFTSRGMKTSAVYFDYYLVVFLSLAALNFNGEHIKL
jgi:hypothetical protein